MRPWFALLIALGMAGSAQPQEAEKEAGRLLDLAAKAQPQESRVLLGQVIKVVAQDKKRRTQAEMEALLLRLARGIERSAQTQNEIQAIFGEKNQKTVSRQVYFRRYREQWVYEQPVRLAVVFDCIKGREPKVQTVLIPQGDG